MLYLRADENGVPQIYERDQTGKALVGVTAARWQEILSEGDLSGQDIVPVEPVSSVPTSTHH